MHQKLQSVTSPPPIEKEKHPPEICEFSGHTWGVVVLILVQFPPRSTGLLPDDDFTIIATWRDQIAKHGVGPRQLPDRSVVSVEQENTNPSIQCVCRTRSKKIETHHCNICEQCLVFQIQILMDTNK